MLGPYLSVVLIRTCESGSPGVCVEIAACIKLIFNTWDFLIHGLGMPKLGMGFLIHGFA